MRTLHWSSTSFGYMKPSTGICNKPPSALANTGLKPDQLSILNAALKGRSSTYLYGCLSTFLLRLSFQRPPHRTEPSMPL